MSLPYARSLDGLTGELQFDDVASSWTAGDPDAEALIRVFRTPKGEFLPDPEFGFDYSLLDKATPSSAAAIKREAERCTRRIVQQRGLQNLVIAVEVQQSTIPAGAFAVIQLSYTTRSGRSVVLPIQVNA